MEGKDLILDYRRFTLRYPAHSQLSVGGTISIPNCIPFFCTYKIVHWIGRIIVILIITL